LTDHDPKSLIDRNGAFRRAERAVNEFDSGSFFEDEKVGALLEAIRFYCDTLNGRYRPLENPSAPMLWDQALAVAERLHAERVVVETKWAEQQRKIWEDWEAESAGTGVPDEDKDPEGGPAMPDDDAPRKLGEYRTGPPDQDDIDALRLWALDPDNRRNHLDTARQILRICNGISSLRAEVMGLKRKLKAARARAKKLGSGRAPLSDDDGPYCKECGNDDRKQLACVDNYANGTRWRCEVCGHEFHTKPKEIEE
jgi:hypothetical protein